MKIGRVIKSLRIEKGWTQKELAEKSEVSRDMVSSLEQCRLNGSITSLNKISKALGVELAYLHVAAIDTDSIPSEKRYAFILLRNAILDVLKDTEEEDKIMSEQSSLF